MNLLSDSETETKEIGRRLGEKLGPGDLVCLYGELGAGKTTMVKGIASAFGVAERDITSASFTIIAEYDRDIPFYHIDLYRVNPGEVFDIGLHEYINQDSIAVIEWPERAEAEIPEKRINIYLTHIEDDIREIRIEGMEL